MLPGTLVGLLSDVPVLALYRELLAEALLVAPRQQSASGLAIPNAALQALVEVAEVPVLFGILKAAWAASHKALRRAQRKDSAAVRRAFQALVVHKIWPLLHIVPPTASAASVTAFAAWREPDPTGILRATAYKLGVEFLLLFSRCYFFFSLSPFYSSVHRFVQSEPLAELTTTGEQLFEPFCSSELEFRV
jgi:hypothetical protein